MLNSVKACWTKCSYLNKTMDFDTVADISVISSMISCVFVLIVLIIGCLLRGWSPDYNSPKFWTRPWILMSLLCSYVINLSLLYFCTNITCISVMTSVSVSVTSRLTIDILGIHVLISLYSPRILLGKRQLVNWTILILFAWATGPVISFLFTNSVTMNNGALVGTESTTLSFSKSTQANSPLDALDIEFETGLLQSSDSTSVRYTTTQDSLEHYQNDEEGDSYCIVNNKSLALFTQITDYFFIACGLGILVAVVLYLKSILNFFQRGQTSLTSSQKLNLKWIEQQCISSALFIELQAVLACLYLYCDYGQMKYCWSIYQCFQVLYPLVFSLSCFLLKEVRSTIFQAYSLLCTCGNQNEDANEPPPQISDS